MAKKNEEFLKRLLATFRNEADEHLTAMSSCLLELEKAPAGTRCAELVEIAFREAHSLKGAARAVNFVEIESACQALESVFAAMKGGAQAGGPLFDLLHQLVKALGGLLAPDARDTGKPALARLVRQIDAAMNELDLKQSAPAAPRFRTGLVVATAAQTGPPPARPGQAISTVRIATAKLDAAMRQVEELFGARLAAAERARELREIAVALVARRKEHTHTEASLRRLEHAVRRSGGGDAGDGLRLLHRLIEQLETGKLFARTLEDKLSGLAHSAAADHRALTSTVDNLLHSVKEMQLLPIAALLETLPAMARELASDQGKQVDVSVRGGEIEIDRRVLEQLKDPLTHLLRNSVDHGIESPELRSRLGKPPCGTIAITVAQKDGGKIEVTVADDGAGIDAGKVKASAARLGELTDAQVAQLGEDEALALVFRSGVSTSRIITDLSGRGLGLAIVREKIERLGGSIDLHTRQGSGTTLRVVAPLTLATFRSILARVGGRLFAVPASSVERVVRVAPGDVRTIENRDTILLGHRAVSLVRLADVLELPPGQESGGSVHAVVLGSDPGRIAFQVDEVVGEQEVLVKTLGAQLARVRNVAGASVLGTGEVVPVLNVSDLVQSAMQSAAAPPARRGADRPAEVRARAVLVVEDSITSRSLLKNILASAGYRVNTAVDGIDAYTALKADKFDLVVTDVEMPRMDGFDLTARIRADKSLSSLPVVLVTALGQREHRERGIEVGANAYIVKSSFDQSDLLQVVRQLIA